MARSHLALALPHPALPVVPEGCNCITGREPEKTDKVQEMPLSPVPCFPFNGYANVPIATRVSQLY